jgi:hypothetical protein
MNRPALTLLALLVAGGPAAAATTQAPSGFSATGQPASYDVNGKAYVVGGYRGAKWGMTVTEVRQVIARDFPGSQVGQDTRDPASHTTLVVVATPHLEPGPGPMAVTYIFGAASGRLIHVNLDWQAVHATGADRDALTVAGSRVVADFIAYYWKLMSVARGVPVGPHSLVLFSGSDDNGGTVEVRLQGVGYSVKTADGQRIEMPPPSIGAQALLHVGFARNATEADVYAIKPGDF